jgi:hypothetical protein
MPACAAAFFGALPTMRLKSLNLAHNKLGTFGFRSSREQSSLPVRILSSASTAFCGSHYTPNQSVLHSGDHSMPVWTSLALSSARMSAADDAVDMLAAALCKCTFLHELFLHHNQITEKGHRRQLCVSLALAIHVFICAASICRLEPKGAQPTVRCNLPHTLRFC